MRTLITWGAVVVAGGVPVSRALPDPLKAAYVYFCLAFVIAVVALLWGSRPWCAVMWPTVAVLFLVGCIASGEIARQPRQAWSVGTQLIIWAGLGPFAFRGLVAKVPAAGRRAVTAFLAMQTASSLAALVQTTGATTLGFATIYGRAIGFASQQNILGMLAGVALVVLLHAWLDSRSIVTLLAIVANAGGLLASGSLTSMGAAALGMVVLLVGRRVSVVSVFNLGVLGGVVLGVAAHFVFAAGYFKSPADRFQQVTGRTQELGTVGERVLTWQYAWAHVKVRPFYGYGLDDLSGGTYDHFTLTHDILLRAWYQGGLALFVGFALILAMSVRATLLAVSGRCPAVAAAGLVAVWCFALTAATFQQAYFWVPLLGFWAHLPPAARPPGAAPLVARTAAEPGPVLQRSRS